MNAWVRMYSTIESNGEHEGSSLTLDLSSKINIVVHGTEQAARNAIAKFGGMAVEMNLSSLKGLNSYPEISFRATDDNDGRRLDVAESEASISIAGDALPHTVHTWGVEVHPDSEPFVDAVAAEMAVFVELC
jgi:hypothetical protein